MPIIEILHRPLPDYVVLAFDRSGYDFGSIRKPNGAVFIFDKECAHLQDLLLMHLLHVVTDFETLLDAVLALVISHKLLVFAFPSEIVFDFLVHVISVHRGSELNDERDSTTRFTFDVELNA